MRATSTDARLSRPLRSLPLPPGLDRRHCAADEEHPPEDPVAETESDLIEPVHRHDRIHDQPRGGPAEAAAPGGLPGSGRRRQRWLRGGQLGEMTCCVRDVEARRVLVPSHLARVSRNRPLVCSRVGRARGREPPAPAGPGRDRPQLPLRSRRRGAGPDRLHERGALHPALQGSLSERRPAATSNGAGSNGR